MAQVPDIPNFTLQDAINAVKPSVETLEGCFDDTNDNDPKTIYIYHINQV
jgi:hypothetical protein